MEARGRGPRREPVHADLGSVPRAARGRGRERLPLRDDFAPGTDIPYTTNIPLERAIEDDVLLVHTWEGQPLPRDHGGPVRMITPRLYAWKGTKWIRKVEFLA